VKYFAQLEDGKVVRVVVAEDGVWLADALGGVWVETSLDGSVSGKPAVIGDAYDEALGFVSPVKVQ